MIDRPVKQGTDLKATQDADLAAEQEIAHQVRRYRLLRGLDYAQLAELSGLDAATIVNIETGNARPFLDRLLLLTIGLGLPDTYFLDRLYRDELQEPSRSKSKTLARHLLRIAHKTQNQHARAVLFSLIDDLPGAEEAMRPRQVYAPKRVARARQAALAAKQTS